MSLRDKLVEILPDLLPTREEEAIKGKELIARVRAVLGDAYSDHSLRSQFSFIALEPDSCLARVANGQGYYLRTEASAPSLHNMFENEAEASREGKDPLHKALALAVRLYDTTGMGVFVYPLEDEESWEHPDLVAVQWPAGSMDESGAYVMQESADPTAHLRAVCVCIDADAESCRRAFFRTMACALCAHEAELLIIGDAPEAADELSRLSSLYGVGVRVVSAELADDTALPGADLIFRAQEADARDLLADLPQLTLAHPRHRQEPLLPQHHLPATAAAMHWAQSCIAKGRVEAYELRVAVN